jgi:hypothetical protein
MIICLVWFSLMIREGEIGMKSSAPGDTRGPGTFFTPCIQLEAIDKNLDRLVQCPNLADKATL